MDLYQAARLAAGIVHHRATHIQLKTVDLPGDHQFILDSVNSARNLIGPSGVPYSEEAIQAAVWGWVGLLELNAA